MAVIALAALALGWAMRPRPVMMVGDGGLYVVRWSDCSETFEGRRHPTAFRHYGWLLTVKWSDGSKRYYLESR